MLSIMCIFFQFRIHLKYLRRHKMYVSKTLSISFTYFFIIIQIKHSEKLKKSVRNAIAVNNLISQTFSCDIGISFPSLFALSICLDLSLLFVIDFHFSPFPILPYFFAAMCVCPTLSLVLPNQIAFYDRVVARTPKKLPMNRRMKRNDSSLCAAAAAQQHSYGDFLS